MVAVIPRDGDSLGLTDRTCHILSKKPPTTWGRWLQSLWGMAIIWVQLAGLATFICKKKEAIHTSSNALCLALQTSDFARCNHQDPLLQSGTILKGGTFCCTKKAGTDMFWGEEGGLGMGVGGFKQELGKVNNPTFLWKKKRFKRYRTESSPFTNSFIEISSCVLS